MDTDESNQFVQRLQFVLSFLSEHGFDRAASAVYEQLESKTEQTDELETGEPAVQSTPEYAPDEEKRVQEYRSASAEPVLQGSLDVSQADAEDAEESQHHHPWPPGTAEALQTRLSGSSRLYEDPDVDEYSSMEDVGYVRRSVSNQQEFIMSQLDFLRTNDDECYFHSGSLQHGGSSSLQRGDSCSNSSSASLSSPGLSSCAQQHDQPEVSSAQQVQGRGSSSAVTGDAAWDSGPAGITFAEPVTTPTKDSQRNSISDLQPSLSRVESLSNSFIEEFESVDGGTGCIDAHSRQESETGSIAGDLGTPPRHSRADRSSSDAGAGTSKQQDRSSDPANDVIDLSPPSPPPDCSADAGIDLSNIFELGLRASSRTSSVDVLQGSVRCYSEPDLSEALFGQQQQLDTGRTWAAYSAGTSGAGSNSSSRANSSLGMASLGGPGGLVIKPRQSAGASRLQSASQHDPEEEVLNLQPKQHAQEQQQQEGAQAQAAVDEQEQAGVNVKQQQDAQQQAQVDDSVLVLSPTHEQQPDACVLTVSQQKDKQQQQQQEQQQLRPQGGSSDSGSSTSTAGPVTPTALGTTIIAASSSDASAAAAADVVAAATAADVDVPCLKPAAEASVADVEASAAPAAAAAATAEDSASPTSPPAAAAAGGAGGFGFTFPTTPPSAVDAAVHEERAERVFSTWASNHSRSLSGALDLEFAAAEDAEADTSSSRPPPESSSPAAAAAEGTTADSADPWGFPALAVPAADDPSTSDAAAGDAAATAAGRSPGEITLVDPVSPVESPFLAGAALASCSKSSSPAGKALSRGGSRAHSSSSAAVRAAVAGNSSRSSSRRLSAAGWQQQQQQQQQALTTSSGGARSPLGDGMQGPSMSGVSGSGHLQQQGSAGYDALGNALIPGLDADAESTGDFSSSGELNAPRYVIDEAGNLLYEYDSAYIENRYETFELRIIHRRRRTGFEDSKEFPIRKNDLIAGRYQVMDFLGSAAFSQAVQALDVATGALVCLKIIKNNKDYFDQSLDEIKLLRYVNNADPDDEHHIVRLYDFFYYKEHLILVCELLRANLYEFQKYQRENGDEPYFTPPRIQRIAIQVLQSLAFLHSLGLVHSDLKPENILIKSYSRCEVKVIDLGSSCFITDHLSSYVQSRSYRAPEVILGLPYGQKIDIWSLGCILAELATGYVLFQNDSLATLLARLEGILGPLPSWMVAQGRYSNRYYTRSRQLYERSKSHGRYELLLPKHTSLRHRVPAADEGFLDFLSYLLTADPTARPSATEALQHPWLSYPYPPVEQIPD